MSDDTNFVDPSVFNPLDCAVCNNVRFFYLTQIEFSIQEMKDPIRLSCQHCFCQTCLDSKTNCPVCGIEFCSSKLTVDRILNYLIESSHELVEVCGNCDKVGYLHFMGIISHVCSAIPAYEFLQHLSTTTL